MNNIFKIYIGQVKLNVIVLIPELAGGSVHYGFEERLKSGDAIIRTNMVFHISIGQVYQNWKEDYFIMDL